MSNIQYEGIYEYCGVQRSGKSTLMVRDTCLKILPFYNPSDIICNFPIFLSGIKWYETNDLIDYILYIRMRKLRHKVIIMDEAGQSLTARGFKDKRQTDLVNFLWQFPKRDIILLYASNPGNSTDIIMRLATTCTILPRYTHGVLPDRSDDYITADIIFNNLMEVRRDLIIRDIAKYQSLFDSYQPIESMDEHLNYDNYLIKKFESS